MKATLIHHPVSLSGDSIRGELRREVGALPSNKGFQPTSLPPETFPSTCGRALGGKAAAEPWR